MPGPKRDCPPGWDYDPSSWSQRIPIALVALVGFGVATYLSLFQLEIIPSVWEPFFGDGSRVILTSGVSNILPIPDAALGAFGYLLDALAGVIGGRARWRTMPWIVILFGLAVGPLGAASIVLVMIQPIVYGEWCTLCLASALISLVMIGPAMDEVLASLQHMRRAKDSGASLWRTLWGLSPEKETVPPGARATEATA
ncbi:MAG: vitamin K epoxide reductase family protein [Myxococcota bacterium]|nr:vitamin K epoxide reductase family protein [Myxococcota bacterium]